MCREILIVQHALSLLAHRWGNEHAIQQSGRFGKAAAIWRPHILKPYNLSQAFINFFSPAECNVGGVLQLLLELQYLGQALRPILRPPRNDLLDQALASVLEKIDQLAEQDENPTFLELDDWCETVQGGNMGGRAELVAKFRTKDMISSTRLNIASFKAWD